MILGASERLLIILQITEMIAKAAEVITAQTQHFFFSPAETIEPNSFAKSAYF